MFSPPRAVVTTLSLALAVALAGCAQMPPSSPGASPDASALPGAPAAGPAVSPQQANADAAAASPLAAAGEAWLSGIQARGEGVRVVDHEVPLVDRDVIGVRHIADRLIPDDVETESVTLYTDKSSWQVWHGQDLVSDVNAAADLVVAAGVRRHGKPQPGLQDPATKASLLDDVQFDTNGDLLAVAPGRTLVSGIHRLTVRVAASDIAPLLTDAGRRVRDASRTPVSGTAKPRRDVDCATDPCVALTFDDGPGPDTTPGLLDTLAASDATATWFVLGPAASKRPDLVRREAAVGEVGNHTWSHTLLNKLDPAKQASERKRGADAVAAAGVPRPTLMRPPYGGLNAATKQLGDPLVLWNLDTLDWLTRDPQAIEDAVRTQVAPGAIVLMHDIHGPSVKAVPGILRDLGERGYTTVTVSGLLGAQPPAGTVVVRGRG